MTRRAGAEAHQLRLEVRSYPAPCLEMACDRDGHIATGLLCCISCGWVLCCVLLLAFNVAIPGLPIFRELLVTAISMTCFLCLACRLLTPTELDHAQFSSFSMPCKQVWSSMKYLATETDTPQFHLVQFEQHASSKKCVKTVLREVCLEVSPHAVAQPTCACCLDDFGPNDQVALLPCGHIFHEDCVMSWFLTRASSGACPMCRAQSMLHASGREVESV